MRLHTLNQRIHDIRRLRQIASVLARYGFGYFVDRLNLGRKLVRLGPIRKLKVFDLPINVRLRRVLEELGPTFIKFGQILSTRPDIMPIELCCELEQLQDNVPTFGFDQVEAEISRELKLPLDRLFNDFSGEPVAAASLAQAHTARLKTGEKVIVKVQRPGIEKTIHTDLEILSELARLAEKYIEEIRPYDPVAIVEEFKESILKELDFTREANNIGRFQRQFAGDDTVYIPRYYPEFCSRRILTMERVEGFKISNLDKITQAKLNAKKIAENGARAFLKQIFEYGFFHADPHPGNLMVMPGNRVAFIDFGMIGRIHSETRQLLSDIMVGLVQHDVYKICDRLRALGAVDESADLKKFEMDMEDFLDRHFVTALSDFKIGAFLIDLLRIVATHKIRIPSDLYLLSKAMVIIEGVGENLDPNFDMVKLTRPFAQKLVRDKRSPGRLVRDIMNFGEGFYDSLRTVPRDLKTIFDKLKKGTLKVEFEHRGLENLITELDKVSNRIAFSVIVAAIIVGSSLIIQSDQGPHFLGYPLIGIIGYIIAGFMGLWLLVAILRSGRL